MWRNNADKYDGSIFKLADIASKEETLTQMKVDRELEEAIKKHGVIQPPKAYEDQFFERINAKKRDIAQA